MRTTLGAARPALSANYADLFDRMPDAGFLIDAETFAVIDVNPATELVLGFPMEKALGCDLAEHIAADERETFAKALRMTRRRYYHRKFHTTWIANPDKTVPLEILACVVELSEDRKALQLICRDITLEREARAKEERYLKELLQLNAKLEALSTHDEMTGLANFRQFKQALHEEHDRAQRYGNTYSIVFCDLDHFKHYNDQHGHPAGDALLRALAEILKDECRTSDLPARYGGEEFAILCRATPGKGAMILAERIRARVAKHPFAFAEMQPMGRISISIGVAEFGNGRDTENQVLKAADEALYASKRDGRDRVTLKG